MPLTKGRETERSSETSRDGGGQPTFSEVEARIALVNCRGGRGDQRPAFLFWICQTKEEAGGGGKKAREFNEQKVEVWRPPWQSVNVVTL